jgi:hypothetical protein
MEKIEINKDYKKLLEKILKYDNYEKIKAIVELGICSYDTMKKYKLENEMDKINLSDKLELERNIEILNKLITETRNNYEEKIYLLNKKNREKNEEEMSKKKDEYEKKILELEEKNKKNIEEYLKKILDLENKNKKDVDEYLKKILDLEERKEKKSEEKLKILKEEKNLELEYIKKLLKEEREKKEEEIENQKKFIEERKDEEIRKLKEENEKYKNKYEKMELNSVLKGKPYEDALEIELKEYFDNNNNIYSIECCSSKKGKGDFIVTNMYSGVRIMLEAKNMNKVSSTIKDQQPKFYNDVLDKNNKYDGGIIISTGMIEGKKNYDFEVYDKKVVSFVERYTLNNPEKIVFIIEMLHQKVQELKINKVITEKKVLDDNVEYYKICVENMKKIKIAYESQMKTIERLRINILNDFSIDIEEYILDNKSMDNTMKENIENKVKKYIELERNKGIKKNILKEKTVKEFEEYIELYKKDKKNGITKRMIGNILNRVYKIDNEEIIIE